MTKKNVTIPTVATSEELLPHYASHGAAGADVRAFIEENLEVAPGESVLVPTGLYFEIPEGYEIQVRPRSGLAFKHQVTVLNTPGTIDHDYRGELKVILINHGKNVFTITPKMRIAQLIVAPVTQAQFTIVKELLATERGSGGFGHTGTH
ncbi:MAG: dUTP diphosphatase [Chlamydiia bacterium]|nr:dUTP diphosphatase [Chlamydiia bacterium]